MITPYRSRPGWSALETDQWRQGGSNPQPSACKLAIIGTRPIGWSEDRWVAPPVAFWAVLAPWILLTFALIIGTSDNFGQLAQSFTFARASQLRLSRSMVRSAVKFHHLRERTMSRPTKSKAPARSPLAGRAMVAPLPSTLEPPGDGMKWADFRAEIEALYLLDRAPATHKKIRQVLDELGGIGLETLDQMTPRAITRWLLAHPDRGSATRRALLSSARAVCSYAWSCGYLKCSPFSAWDFFRNLPPDPEKKHHSAEALGKVFAQARKETLEKGWKEARTEAAFAMAALVGMRKKEILYLRPENLDLKARVIYILPEGSESRLKTRASAQPIPCPEPLAVYLERWLPISGSECGWVFPNCYRGENNPWNEGATHNKPLNMLRALGDRSGVADLTWHSLRHSWGSHAESLWGLPEMVAQRILRHTTPRTTRRYRHSDMVNLQIACASIRLPGAG